MSPPAALLELGLRLTPLPPLFLSSEGSGFAAARSRAALRTELAEGLAAVRACAPARAPASTAWPSSWRTLIMLLMSKESEAAASRTTRKTVARTRAAPDSDLRCRLPDDLCARNVLIGMPVSSWRPSSPGAGIVVAAARAAVLGPLAEDGEVAVRRRHHRAAAHRPVDELAPRAAEDVRGPARRLLRVREDVGLLRLREGVGEIELVGHGGHAVDVGRVVGPGPAGSRPLARAQATARGADELQGRRGRAQVEGVEDAVTVGVAGTRPECRGGGREGQGADDDEAPGGQASETGHGLFPFCGRITGECLFRQTREGRSRPRAAESPPSGAAEPARECHCVPRAARSESFVLSMPRSLPERRWVEGNDPRIDVFEVASGLRLVDAQGRKTADGPQPRVRLE